MPSSRAEEPGAAAPAPAAVLRELAAGYDAALAALLQGDLEAVADALGRGEALLAIPAAAADPGLDDLHRAATAAHGRLFGVLAALHARTRDELARARQGRRALRGYAAVSRRSPG